MPMGGSGSMSVPLDPKLGNGFSHTVAYQQWIILHWVNLANLVIFSPFAKIYSTIFIHCPHAQ